MTDYIHLHSIYFFFFSNRSILLLNLNIKKKSSYHFSLIHRKQTNCYLLKIKHTNTHPMHV